MRLVKVYGQLAKRLGQRVFRADVASPAEAVRFLCANFPGLDQWLIDSDQDGIGYRVKVSKTTVGEEDFGMSCNPDATISITPVLTGAGGGVGKLFAGIGLVAAAILLAPLGGGFLGLGAGAGTFGAAGAGFTLGAAASTAIGTIGASLVLGGVAQMISPRAPAIGSVANYGGAGNASPINDPRALQSYNFNGIQNTSTQGVPINLVYGKMFVGSTVLSAGVFNSSKE
jgi:predicted phage tail protein